MSEALAHANIYTEEDYYNLPENVRAELIDGQIYYMAAPSRVHQEILGFLFKKIANYIDSKEGSCKVYPSPFAVKLFSGGVPERLTGLLRLPLPAIPVMTISES